MNWFIGTMVFFVVWWIVLFTVLPFGAKPPEEVEPGHEIGAPEKPRLWIKALITTVIAIIIWGIIYWVVANGLISFRGGY